MRAVNLIALGVVAAALVAPAAQTASKPTGLGADDLARAYALPPASVGARHTVAIVTAGAYPSLAGDLATYRAQYGLPPCTTHNGCLTITDFHGGPPVAPSGDEEFQDAEESWAQEASLDVDMVSAACPGCRIMVVQTPDIDATGEPDPPEKAADYGVGVATAVKQGADVVSLSDMIGLDTATATGPIGKSVYHPGVPLFASIGDVGFAPFHASATSSFYSFPAGLPWVVSVGGTSLSPNADGSFTETAWPGLSGDCSALPPAAGQPAAIAAYCGGQRAGADIAAVADPAHGPAVYDSYAPHTGKPKGWSVSGGTSASSPFVAAWYARSTHARKAIGPSALYAAPSASFHDVTSGGAPVSTCAGLGWAPQVCQAGPGWDGPTGLGSPHGLGHF